MLYFLCMSRILAVQRPTPFCRVLSLPPVARFHKLPPPFSSATKAAAKSVLDENGANGARPAPLEAYEALTANAAGVQDMDSERFPSPLRDDVTNDNPLDPTEPPRTDHRYCCGSSLRQQQNGRLRRTWLPRGQQEGRASYDTEPPVGSVANPRIRHRTSEHGYPHQRDGREAL